MTSRNGTTRRGTRLTRLVGMGLVASAGLLGALAQPALGKDLTYSVDYQMSKGKYTSSATCSPGCDNYGGVHSAAESDENFAYQVLYKGLKIPRQGSAAPPGHPISVKAGPRTVTDLGDWSLVESYWTQDNPNAPINCQGTLFDASTGTPHIFSAPRNTAADLKLDIQAGDTFKVSDATGTNCGETDNWHAFYPATFEPPGDGFLPDMLTARVSVPLGRLRDLSTGHALAPIKVDQGDAKRLPPKNCADFYGTTYTCTQSLQWSGAVTFKRTG